MPQNQHQGTAKNVFGFLKWGLGLLIVLLVMKLLFFGLKTLPQDSAVNAVFGVFVFLIAMTYIVVGISGLRGKDADVMTRFPHAFIRIPACLIAIGVGIGTLLLLLACPGVGQANRGLLYKASAFLVQGAYGIIFFGFKKTECDD